MPACACPTCAEYSRAYVHHLFRTGEMLGPILLSQHNLYVYQRLMADLRAAIGEGRLDGFAAAQGGDGERRGRRLTGEVSRRSS